MLCRGGRVIDGSERRGGLQPSGCFVPLLARRTLQTFHEPLARQEELASEPASTPTNRPGTSAEPGQCFWLSAPALSEVMAPRRYRDVCSIARSLRGLLDACSIPRRGYPKGA